MCIESGPDRRGCLCDHSSWVLRSSQGHRGLGSHKAHLPVALPMAPLQAWTKCLGQVLTLNARRRNGVLREGKTRDRPLLKYQSRITNKEQIPIISKTKPSGKLSPENKLPFWEDWTHPTGPLANTVQYDYLHGQDRIHEQSDGEPSGKVEVLPGEGICWFSPPRSCFSRTLWHVCSPFSILGFSVPVTTEGEEDDRVMFFQWVLLPSQRALTHEKIDTQVMKAYSHLVFLSLGTAPKKMSNQRDNNKL